MVKIFFESRTERISSLISCKLGEKGVTPSLLTEQVIGWNYLLLRKRLCFDWKITLEWKSWIQCYMYSVKTLDICRDVSEVVNLWYSRFEKSRLYIQILESKVPLCLPTCISIFLYLVLGIKLRTLPMLGKCSVKFYTIYLTCQA